MRKRAYKELRREGKTTLHTGRGNDRRKDKLAYSGPQWLRRYEQRYSRS